MRPSSPGLPESLVCTLNYIFSIFSPRHFNFPFLKWSCHIRWPSTLWKIFLGAPKEVSHMWMNRGMDYLDINRGADTVPRGVLKPDKSSTWKQNRELEGIFDTLHCLSLRSNHDDCDIDDRNLSKVVRAVMKFLKRTMSWIWQNFWFICVIFPLLYSRVSDFSALSGGTWLENVQRVWIERARLH